MYFVKPLFLCIIVMILMGCQEITDDLNPSNTDERPSVVEGSFGSQPGQKAADFTINDSKGNVVVLNDELISFDGLVLYFTMWCPTCDSHMDHMRSRLVDDFPNIRFLIVDYVTGSIANARASQLASGYASFTVLSDSDLNLFYTFNGSMGSTVIIQADGEILLNEDYKNGVKVREVLTTL